MDITSHEYTWFILVLKILFTISCRHQWLRGLRRGVWAVRLLGLRVRIPPEGGGVDVGLLWVCVLPGRVLCIGLITGPEESYRVRYVWVRSWSPANEEALSHYGLLGPGKNITLRETLQKRFENLKEIQGALVNKGNEPSDFAKLGEFLVYMRAY